MKPAEHCPDCGALWVEAAGLKLCPHCGLEEETEVEPESGQPPAVWRRWRPRPDRRAA